MKKLEVKLIEGKKVFNSVLTVKDNCFLITTDDSYMVKVIYNNIIGYDVNGNELLIKLNNGVKVNLKSESIDEIIKVLSTKQLCLRTSGGDAKSDFSNNQSSINNSQINSTKLLIFVASFIGIIIFVLMHLYYIPFGSRAGDVREAKESAVKYFQLFNTSSHLIHCKPHELEGDIILVKCETTDNQLISYFNSNTLWYGFLPSADGVHYWDYGADNKESVIEYLGGIKNN